MASPRGAAIEAKGITPRANQRGFFTVARPSGGGWGTCDQRRTVMTRARALKKVIRARVARTGERYTTARRHVLRELAPAKAAPPPATTPSLPASTRGGLSDAKAREKTGHGLDHWFAVLDRFGGAEKGHTALARHLYLDHSIPSWYCQGLTVAYERARGVRAINQRCDGEFEVSVSRLVHANTAEVIGAITDARRRKRWAQNVDASLLEALAAGVSGPRSTKVVIRPDGLGRFRYKWGDTVVQFYLTPKPGGKVSLVVTNSKLADSAMVEARRARWRAAVGAVALMFART